MTPMNHDEEADPSGWRPIVPVPAGTLLYVPPHRLGAPSKLWDYRGADSRLLCRTARFDPPGAKKEFAPLAFGAEDGGVPEWRFRALPVPRPLYGLDRLAANPEAPVVVVEGEKTADAAQRRFPNHVVVTSPGGSKAADSADWSVLAGRAVVIWPDRDEAGVRYAASVRAALLASGAASVKLVAVPAAYPERWDLADDPPAGVSAEDLLDLLAEAKPFEADAGPDLSVLRQGRRPPPDLPLEVFGPEMAKWIVDAAEGAGSPKDYVAAAVLAASAALIGNTRYVEAWAGWSEPCVLWLVAIGDPSSNKSPAFDPVMTALRHVEEYIAQGFNDVHRTWVRDAAIATAAREKWDRALNAAVQRNERFDEQPPEEPPAEPMRPRVVVNDPTPEALANVIAANPRGLLLIRDELTGWLRSFDRYSNESGRSLWIEAYGGRPFTIDRVKLAQPIRIPRLAVSVLGGIQPDRFAELLADADDGLPARLLCVWPDPLPPIRPLRAASLPFINDAFRRLADLPLDVVDGKPMPTAVRLSPAAAAAFQKWRTEHHPKDGGGGFLASAFGKFPGLVLRLSLVLAHLRAATIGGPAPSEVSHRDLLAAVGFVETYVKPMAVRVYGDASLPVADRKAAILAHWIKENRPARINASDIRRNARLPGLREASDVASAIEVLVEARWLSSAPSREGGTKGRQKSDYLVDPRVYEASAR